MTIMASALRQTEVLKTLEELKSKIEITYGVRIQGDALNLAVNLAWEWFNGEGDGGNVKLEEKAMELVERACERLRNKIETNVDEDELDMDEYKRHRSQIEYNEVKIEKDSASKLWLSRVERELQDSMNKWHNFIKKWKPSVMLRVRSKSRARQIYILEKLRQEMVSCLQKAQKSSDLVPLSRVVQQLGVVIMNLEFMIHKNYKQKSMVGPDEIAEVVSNLTGIPSLSLNGNMNIRLRGLKGRLRNRVIGQDHAIHALVDALSRTGPKGQELNGAVGSFLFLGDFGVGKAELAKALAEELFGNEDALIRIDMSEFMEPDSVSHLVGVPSRSESCVQYREGQLVEAVTKRPYSVLLFENVEKAHVSVMDVLVEIIKYRQLKYDHGLTVRFDKTLIIMTSVVGVDRLYTFCTCYLQNGRDQIIQELRSPRRIYPGHYCPMLGKGLKQVMQEARRMFKPELLELLDKVVVFDMLSRDHLKAITRLQLRDIVSTMTQRRLTVYPSEDALDVIITRAIHFKGEGGKAIKKWIEEKLVPLLLELLAKVEFNYPSIYIDTQVGTKMLSFRYDKSGSPVEDLELMEFKESIAELRMMHRKEKYRVNMIYGLRKEHFELMTRLSNIESGANLLHTAGAVQELVNMIDELVKNAIDVKLISMQTLGCLDEEALNSQRKRAKKRLKGLKTKLTEGLVEQYQATYVVTEAFLRSIDTPPDLLNRPVKSFLFLGLTTTGKTDLEKYLANHFVTDDGMNLLIRINLSEYTDSDSLSRLFIIPPRTQSYGHEQHRLRLLEAIKRRPYSILLFDRVEKAHISVFSTLLSILDHGILSDREGETMDFRNAVFIITSDLGNKEIITRLFVHSSSYNGRDRGIQQGDRHFRSELLNRVDEIVFFDPFSHEQLREVARLPMMAGSHLEEKGPDALPTPFFHLFRDGSNQIEKTVFQLSKGLIKGGSCCQKSQYFFNNY